MRSSMLKESAVIVFALVVLGVAPSIAQAATITLNYDFVASDFISGFPPVGGAPVDPVFGSFSVSFDNASDLVDVTAGLTASINLPLTDGIGFTYVSSKDLFLLGDLLIGVDSLATQTNDFALSIRDVSTNPTPWLLSYITADSIRFFDSVSVSLVPTQVPEPATLSLLGVGLAAVGMRHYRRRA